MKDILPIGSIIEINTIDKKDNNKYFIVGRNIKHNDKLYDYVCLKYPFGYVQNMDFTYINDQEVKYLHHLGDINY